MNTYASISKNGFVILQKDELVAVDGGSRMGYDFGQWLYRAARDFKKGFEDLKKYPGPNEYSRNPDDYR